MPTVIIRRTRVVSDKMESNIFTSPVAQRLFVPHAIGSSAIGSILPTAPVAQRALGSEVIARRKLTYFEDVGSKAPPTGGSAYITFSRPFAASPTPSLTKKSAYSEATYQTRVPRIRPGSMWFYGSPAGYVYYRAIGSA